VCIVNTAYAKDGGIGAVNQIRPEFAQLSTDQRQWQRKYEFGVKGQAYSRQTNNACAFVFRRALTGCEDQHLIATSLQFPDGEPEASYDSVDLGKKSLGEKRNPHYCQLSSVAAEILVRVVAAPVTLSMF
jgi:hypothetical protein